MDVKLDELRKQIDTIDEGIIDLIASRVKVVEEIGVIKKKHSMEIKDESRWEEVLTNIQAQARAQKLNEAYITQIWMILHTYALTIEQSV